MLQNGTPCDFRDLSQPLQATSLVAPPLPEPLLADAPVASTTIVIVRSHAALEREWAATRAELRQTQILLGRARDALRALQGDHQRLLSRHSAIEHDLLVAETRLSELGA